MCRKGSLWRKGLRLSLRYMNYTKPLIKVRWFDVEVRWKSDKQKYEDYIKQRKEIVALLKKQAKPEKLSKAELEYWMRTNQTL